MTVRAIAAKIAIPKNMPLTCGTLVKGSDNEQEAYRDDLESELWNPASLACHYC